MASYARVWCPSFYKPGVSHHLVLNLELKLLTCLLSYRKSGRWLGRQTGPRQKGGKIMFKSGQKSAVMDGWVCSSHPEVIWDAPGKCPRCRLELESGTILVAETRPVPQSSRRWFLKTGLALLSGLFWVSFPLRHNKAYGADTDSGGGMGMMGG